jgi:methionine aminopeptidase
MTFKEFEITGKSLYEGLNEVKPSACLSDISHAIQKMFGQMVFRLYASMLDVV